MKRQISLIKLILKGRGLGIKKKLQFKTFLYSLEWTVIDVDKMDSSIEWGLN